MPTQFRSNILTHLQAMDSHEVVQGDTIRNGGIEGLFRAVHGNLDGKVGNLNNTVRDSRELVAYDKAKREI